MTLYLFTHDLAVSFSNPNTSLPMSVPSSSPPSLLGLHKCPHDQHKFHGGRVRRAGGMHDPGQRGGEGGKGEERGRAGRRE